MCHTQEGCIDGAGRSEDEQSNGVNKVYIIILGKLATTRSTNYDYKSLVLRTAVHTTCLTVSSRCSRCSPISVTVVWLTRFVFELSQASMSSHPSSASTVRTSSEAVFSFFGSFLVSLLFLNPPNASILSVVHLTPKLRDFSLSLKFDAWGLVSWLCGTIKWLW